MAWKVVQDIVVPKETGKTMRVNKGQVFRVIEHEGKQVLEQSKEKIRELVTEVIEER